MLDAILVAAILALFVLQLGGSTIPALALGAIGFIAFVGGFTWYARRDIERVVAEYRPMFSTREDAA